MHPPNPEGVKLGGGGGGKGVCPVLAGGQKHGGVLGGWGPGGV